MASCCAHVSTVDAARDIDVLRAALGDRQLYYLGASYGTFLGATYAGLFPSRVGRMVLDGALDPTLSNKSLLLGQTKGFQTALDSFIADCQRTVGLPASVGSAGSRSEDRHASQVAGRAARADRGGWPPAHRGARGPRVSARRSTPLSTSERCLRTGLQQAFAGNGSTLLRLADFYTERRSDGTYPNLLEANLAINCADKGSDQTIS